jgi:hypothetical protein
MVILLKEIFLRTSQVILLRIPMFVWKVRIRGTIVNRSVVIMDRYIRTLSY